MLKGVCIIFKRVFKNALPTRQKRDIHINECVRRLRNCKPELPWETKSEFLQDYVIRMFHAGYSEKFRQDVIKQAIARYEGMLAADRDGQHPLYRDREWFEEERRSPKPKKKTTWLTRGGFDTVIMCPATPNGELAKMFQQVVDSAQGPVKFKIQEVAGRSVHSILQNTNPSKQKGCEATDCLACKHGRGVGGACRKNNVGYSLVCDACGGDKVCYIGETGQNVYTRGLKHAADYRTKHNDSSLWKHAQNVHGGSLDVSYSMKVVDQFRDPLSRQVNEAVRITRCEAETQLNSKTEWHGPATVRLVAEGGV